MRTRAVRKKRKGVIVKLLLCAFVVYSAVSLVKISIDIKQRQDQLAVLSENVEKQQVENDTVKSAIEKGMTKEEVEKISRDKLDLASPDERVFINIDGQ